MERNFLERLKAAENFLERLSVLGEQTIRDARTFGHPLSMSPPGILFNSAAAMPSFLDEIGKAEESMRRLSGPVAYDESGRLVSGAGKVAIQELINREDGPGSAAMTEAATRGAALAGGTSLAGSAPKGALRTFGGTAAKTANHEALKLAKSMAKKGATREEIWDKTGWFKGVDGKWRFEIDDSAMRLSTNASNVVPLKQDLQTNYSNAISHSEWEKAYGKPWSDVDVRYRPSASGSYYPDTGKISVSGPTTDDLRSVALHEMSHKTANMEGFAKGSSPSEAFDNFRQIKNARLSELEKKIEAKQAELGVHGYRPAKSDPELKKLYDEYDRIVSQVAASEDEVYKWYRNNAGEVEARNVQARRNMTAEERRATPPWLTQDTPDADQIVRFGGDDLEREKANFLRYLLSE